MVTGHKVHVTCRTDGRRLRTENARHVDMWL